MRGHHRTVVGRNEGCGSEGSTFTRSVLDPIKGLLFLLPRPVFHFSPPLLWSTTPPPPPTCCIIQTGPVGKRPPAPATRTNPSWNPRSRTALLSPRVQPHWCGERCLHHLTAVKTRSISPAKPPATAELRPTDDGRINHGRPCALTTFRTHPSKCG